MASQPMRMAACQMTNGDVTTPTSTPATNETRSRVPDVGSRSRFSRIIFPIVNRPPPPVWASLRRTACDGAVGRRSRVSCEVARVADRCIRSRSKRLFLGRKGSVRARDTG